jgi:hypothetical protein
MSDLDVNGNPTDKKEVPLTPEQQMDLVRQDIQELARGLNVQATLLQAIVAACNLVCQSYNNLSKKPEEAKPNE